MTAFYIIIAILIFGILIIIHEFGHFTAAKLCGVKVNEFAVGMGSALVKKQKGETLFTVRCIPFGGFCAMAGEDEESDDPRAFTSQSAWKRIIILCAGSFNNFLLGLIIVMILYSSAEAFYAPVIGEFMEGCPYESEELLQVGDRFLKINGRRVYQLSNVNEFLSADEDGTYDLVIRRDARHCSSWLSSSVSASLRTKATFPLLPKHSATTILSAIRLSSLASSSRLPAEP